MRNSSRWSLKVTGRSAIATWPVSSITILREPSISSTNLSASRDGDDHVLLAPDHQRGAADVGQAVAEVVFEVGPQRGLEAGPAGAAHEALEGQVGLQPGAGGGPRRPARRGAGGGGGRSARRRATSIVVARAMALAAAITGCLATSIWETPAAATSTSRSTSSGRWMASSADDVAAHRVAHDHAGTELQPVEQLGHHARVEADRDLLLGHLRGAEAGQVGRDHPAPLRRSGGCSPGSSATGRPGRG